MEKLFLHFMNMGLSATPLMLTVILARWLMKRAPRWIVCLLWAVVALRLCCPFSFQSPIGLMPSQPPILQTQVDAVMPGVVFHGTMAAEPTPDIAAPELVIDEQISFTGIASVIWAIGVGAMLLYLLLSYGRLHRMVREAVPVCPGVWECDAVRTPFILGVLFPKVYLPSGIQEHDLRYIIAHETAHLKRRDPLWKPLGFLLLSVYWFHPLVWAAYLLMSKDIELACDERVIRELNMADKKAYSTVLLECSSSGKLVYACPVAFGEVAVKERIMNILKYRKPAVWVVVVSLIGILAGAVCFMTTPATAEQDGTIQTDPANDEQDGAIQADPVNDEQDGAIQADPANDEWSAYPNGVRTEDYTGENFTAKVMIVRNPAQVFLGISNPSGFTADIPGKRLDDAVADSGAIAGVNGGKFFDDGTASSSVGSTPMGLVYSQGKQVWDTYPVLGDAAAFAGFNEDNILIVNKWNISAERAEQLKIRDGCTAGPALIIDGQVNSALPDSGYNPRTAIGQRADGAVIFICVNGRQPDSLGATYPEVADIMVQYGAVNACAMDGGSATAMMQRDSETGEILTLTSYPSGMTRSRAIPDFWLVVPEE